MQGVTPRNSRNATSTNLSFPHLVTPSSNKSTPWSTPNHSPSPYGTLSQGTTHTPHNNMSQHWQGFNELEPRPPTYAPTASSYDHRDMVWSSNGSSCQLQPSFDHSPSVETLTPGHNWPFSHNHGNGQSNSLMNNVNTLPLVSADGHNRQGVSCHGNSGLPGLMDYQYYPTVGDMFNGSGMDQFGSQCYSLFSDHGVSPFPMYTPTSGGDNHGGHSSAPPNQSPVCSTSINSRVELPSNGSLSGSCLQVEEDKTYDEWPNI